jgi:hypothetical protein
MSVKKKAEAWLTGSLHTKFKRKAKRKGTSMASIFREAARAFVKKK